MLQRVKQFKNSRYELFAIAIIAFAVLLRLVLAAEGWPQTNSDEDTMGLMALHIANRGELPIFYYGQNYMGAFEAYLGAALFRLFGISVFTLRLGTILLFTLFMVSMYLLTSLLYTKKLALVVLVLLSLGTSVLMYTQLMALGGYPELLLFGALSILLASWLALTSGQYSSRRIWLWRLLGYLCWGLVVGLGFWSDFLMLPFILVSGLLLALFCWRELLKGAMLLLILGLVIGAFPLIAYNLKAPPGKDTLSILRSLHSNGSVELAQNHDYNQLPLVRELRGTMLIALPSATGGPTFCADSELQLFGHTSLGAFPCSHVFESRRLVFLALGWSLGYVILWLVAVLQTIRALWKLRHHFPERASFPEKRQAIIRHFARLALLASAGLTLLLFISSPESAVWPTNARYLIGLLVATPALLWPLWAGVQRAQPFAGGLGAGRPGGLAVPQPPPPASPPQQAGAQRAQPFAGVLLALKVGIILLVGIVLLVGTISVFYEIPIVQANRSQQNALISNLLQIKATHIYSEYWTCDRIIFESQEQIICGTLDDQLQPSYNRYPPYYATVQADPHASYVFPLASAQANAIAKQVAHSKKHYRRFVFDGYVVYQPV